MGRRKPTVLGSQVAGNLEGTATCGALFFLGHTPELISSGSVPGGGTDVRII
jgi:hypothetical protein